jgi:hypothetical protein
VTARKRPQPRSEEHRAPGESPAHPVGRQLPSGWLTASAEPGLRNPPRRPLPRRGRRREPH